jgi:hypothetical protein
MMANGMKNKTGNRTKLMNFDKRKLIIAERPDFRTTSKT